jgi:phenylpyruvate tautomerase PptA (4-oxalocrotonate tautomerase family)
MPMLELTLPEGELSDDAKGGLQQELAAALLRAERAPDTEFFRSISWCHLFELPTEAMRTVDGVAAPHAVVQVTTPEGALSDRRRAEMVDEMTKLVLGATGWGDEAALRVWVMCREIDEGSWGAGGQVIQFEQLRAAAKAESEKEGSGREQVPAAREAASTSA